MIPVTQTKVVVKNSKGEEIVNGNCYAAVIASIMELPITEVPNVEVLFGIPGAYWFQVMETFISNKGWDLCTDDRFKCFHPELAGEQNEEWARNYFELQDKHYIVSGKSNRGFYHVCIYKNGGIIFDPHPSREGLITLETFSNLERK